MTPTKRRVLDAAIDILGTEGLRALTHGRIDERAGVPKGSTSNYFRTREALLTGVLDSILERELPEVSAAVAPSSAAELIDGLCTLIVQLTTVNRTVTTARYVLFMEASHDARLRNALSRGRAELEPLVVVALASLGARNPQTAATAVAAVCGGLILHRIARHDTTDPRPALELVVQAALTDLSSAAVPPLRLR